jgi:DNA-binding NarL/FixJ family response regulator
LVGSESCRSEPRNLLLQMGFQCGEMEDPYAAMAELARRPRSYGALVLSLLGLYREELQLIAAVKRRWMHVEVWLTHTDGRAAALAEAMRMGADGLLTEDGLHRTAAPPAPEAATSVSPVSTAPRSTPVMAPMDDANAATTHAADMYIDDTTGEPVLSEEELRALLHEPPAPLPTESD